MCTGSRTWDHEEAPFMEVELYLDLELLDNTTYILLLLVGLFMLSICGFSNDINCL